MGESDDYIPSWLEGGRKRDCWEDLHVVGMKILPDTFEIHIFMMKICLMLLKIEADGKC